MAAPSDAVTVRLSQHNGGRDWIAVTPGARRAGIGPTPGAAVDALWRLGFGVDGEPAAPAEGGGG